MDDQLISAARKSQSGAKSNIRVLEEVDDRSLRDDTQKVDSFDCGGVVYGTTVQLRFRSSVRNTAHRDRVGELREQGIGGLDSHKVTVRVDRKDRA